MAYAEPNPDHFSPQIQRRSRRAGVGRTQRSEPYGAANGIHMSANTLGRLNRVPLREAWASEASDFTPWLAQPDNLKLLGEAVEMRLEPEAQEKRVGPFRADLLCRDLDGGGLVLVENQLERTDHTHLGQLLTYAGGLEAVTIIWIAERDRKSVV